MQGRRGAQVSGTLRKSKQRKLEGKGLLLGGTLGNVIHRRKLLNGVLDGSSLGCILCFRGADEHVGDAGSGAGLDFPYLWKKAGGRSLVHGVKKGNSVLGRGIVVGQHVYEEVQEERRIGAAVPQRSILLCPLKSKGLSSFYW